MESDLKTPTSFSNPSSWTFCKNKMKQLLVITFTIMMITSCGKDEPTKEEISKAWDNVELPGPPDEQERNKAIYVSKSNFVYKGEELSFDQIEKELKKLKEKTRVMTSIDENSNRELLLKLQKLIEQLNLSFSMIKNKKETEQ